MKDQSFTRISRKRVSVTDIEMRPEVFQFRHVEVDERHVDALAGVLKGGNALDPLTLWKDPTSQRLVVVDGHHRVAAYKQAGWQKKVPVVVHSCSLEEARLLALQENGKTRLPLTNEERMDAAWSLVCLDRPSYSKRTIVENTGVSDGTVAKMRRTHKELLGPERDGSLPDHWWQALAMLKGAEDREYTEEDRQAMIDAKAAQLDDKIGKALGHMAAHQIEAACAVVRDRLGRQGMKVLFELYADDIDLMIDDDMPF